MKSSIIAFLVLASATAVSAADKSADAPADPAKDAAADSAAAAAAAAATEAPKKEKLVCHTDKMTGTRTKVRRICRTQAQWDEIYENTRSGMNNFSRGSNTTAAAISDGAGGSPLPNAGAPR